MKKFVSYEKLSKKNRRAYDKQQRADWNGINPVTRQTENRKKYNRKRSRRWMDDAPSGGISFMSYVRGTTA